MWFKSKRSASDFLTTFNSSVNDTLRGLNLITSDLYSRYLEYIFVLPNSILTRFKNSLSCYNDKLPYLFKDFGEGNSSFQISSFYILFNNVFDCIESLLSFAKSKSNYHLVNCLNSSLKTITLLETSFKDSLKNPTLKNDYKNKVLSISYKKSVAKVV